MSLKALRAALALGLGLAAVTAGVTPSAAVTGDGPVRLAIAVPIVVREGTTGLITSDALEAYTRPLGDLTRQLDAVIDRPVAIGIDPMIIVSIRILGTSAPESALAWLQRLESASNPVFALAYADSDITLATQVGSRVLGPESFDFAIDPALFAPPVDPTATPAPTPNPAEPVLPPLPTTEDLLEWPYSVTGIAWPRDDTVVASDLRTIAASDFTTTIMSSSNLALSPGAGATAQVDGERILVSDASVSAALRNATHAVTVEEQQSTITALAQSVAAAGAAQQGDRATVFATLDRTIPASGSQLAEALSALQSNPAVTLIPISEALVTPPAAATVEDMPQSADSILQVTRLLDAEAAERRFATVAHDPIAITADRRLHLLGLLSAAWVSSPDAWSTASLDFLTVSTELRSAITVVESSSFNLLADRGFLPIAVSNELTQAVTVYVTVRPETALLAIGQERVQLVIEPGAQAKAQIPVQAISNGVVEVQVTIASVAGVPIGAPTVAEINVQAGWETPIVVVIAVIVVAVFGVGIVRNILRRRKTADV
ncbi:MAG: hypothetical protein JWP85_1251 [Rhodoglobus sp.]|nr:hypothetical protein [Rhodoglobus sp.]